jgi:hypothetical protein
VACFAEGTAQDRQVVEAFLATLPMTVTYAHAALGFPELGVEGGVARLFIRSMAVLSSSGADMWCNCAAS